jgi:hypothetical protein
MINSKPVRAWLIPQKPLRSGKTFVVDKAVHCFQDRLQVFRQGKIFVLALFLRMYLEDHNKRRGLLDGVMDDRIAPTNAATRALVSAEALSSLDVFKEDCIAELVMSCATS